MHVPFKPQAGELPRHPSCWGGASAPVARPGGRQRGEGKGKEKKYALYGTLPAGFDAEAVEALIALRTAARARRDGAREIEREREGVTERAWDACWSMLE